MKISEEAKNLLLRAVALLEGNGWTQRAFSREIDGVDCFCAEGALLFSVKRDAQDMDGSGFREASDRIREVLRENHGYLNGLISWNDEVAQNKQDVINLFLEAAND